MDGRGVGFTVGAVGDMVGVDDVGVVVLGICDGMELVGLDDVGVEEIGAPDGMEDEGSWVDGWCVG
jgi:hypothetical protein